MLYPKNLILEDKVQMEKIYIYKGKIPTFLFICYLHHVISATEELSITIKIFNGFKHKPFSWNGLLSYQQYGNCLKVLWLLRFK